MTFIDCYEQSLGESDETTIEGQNVYYFGTLIEGGSTPLSIPTMNTINYIEKLGQTYQEISLGNHPRDGIIANANLINGVPFYKMYGKAAHTVANTKQTVTNFTTTEGRKPRDHIGKDIGSSSDPEVVYSVLWHDFRLAQVKGKDVTFSSIGKGLKHELASITMPTPTYPSSETGSFTVLNYVKWGADGSETELDSVESVELGASQSVVPYIGTNGYYYHINEWSPITTAISITISKENTTLRADCKAGTTRSLLWKFSKGDATRYIEVDCATSIPKQFTEITELNRVIGYNIIFELQNPTFTIQDYVADTFYTIPT